MRSSSSNRSQESGNFSKRKKAVTEIETKNYVFRIVAKWLEAFYGAGLRLPKRPATAPEQCRARSTRTQPNQCLDLSGRKHLPGRTDGGASGASGTTRPILSTDRAQPGAGATRTWPGTPCGPGGAPRSCQPSQCSCSTCPRSAPAAW